MLCDKAIEKDSLISVCSHEQITAQRKETAVYVKLLLNFSPIYFSYYNGK